MRRCMSLAKALRKFEIDCVFFTPEKKTPLPSDFDFDIRQGSETTDPEATINFASCANASAIVLDSYAWSSDDIQKLTQTGLRVVIIDDLADRILPVDVIVNPSPVVVPSQYAALPGTRFLLGPQFAIL